MSPRAIRFCRGGWCHLCRYHLPALVAAEPRGARHDVRGATRAPSDPVYLAIALEQLGPCAAGRVAYAGAAFLLARRSLALAGFGFLWFVLWAVFELVGVTLNLFTVNFTWRAGYAAADDATQARLQTLLAGFPGIWDGLFFLVLVFFLLGTLCLGLAAIRANGLEKLVGVLLLIAVPLTSARDARRIHALTARRRRGGSRLPDPATDIPTGDGTLVVARCLAPRLYRSLYVGHRRRIGNVGVSRGTSRRHAFEGPGLISVPMTDPRLGPSHEQTCLLACVTGFHHRCRTVRCRRADGPTRHAIDSARLPATRPGGERGSLHRSGRHPAMGDDSRRQLRQPRSCSCTVGPGIP